MIQEQTKNQIEHKLTMLNRKRVDLTGVTEVVSFDSKEVVLETIDGALHFGGEDLHVKRLTLERGEIVLEGRIQEISYHESAKDKTAGSILGRLFR